MDAELHELESGSAEVNGRGVSVEPTVIPFVYKSSSWASFISSLSRYRVILLLISLAVLCFTAGVGVYFGTVRKEWINIHLVPHSHDDVGWLRTPEFYYEHTVKFILNNVVHELRKDPRRTFTYVETYFFWRWWIQQNEETQNLVRRLVASGQLNFAGGAWTMNDEAVTNYQSIIDQFTWGLRKLNETFEGAARPWAAWQIDTFGHSREMASLLVQMGYKGLFFARIDEDERWQRKSQRAMEFQWDDRDGATSILTSVLYKHYNPPSGYHYEKEINEGANLDGFLEAVREWASVYQTRNVLIPMGDDFTYYDAYSWYDNMDSLMRQVEERKGSVNVNMFYSTPERYLSSIRESPIVFPRKTGDFFPYASDQFSYWSGFYTSRPGLKFFERISNNILQTLKQLLAMTGAGESSEGILNGLREALAVLMHHDAITGTSKQEVNDHYMLLLYQAVKASFSSITDALRTLSVLSNRGGRTQWEPCLNLNESSCHISENSREFIVAAYNSLSWPVKHAIRLPVTSDFYTVRNSEGEVLDSQLVPLPEEVLKLPGRKSSATKELVFLGEIPALGFSSFHISSIEIHEIFQQPFVSSNVTFHFHQYTGRLIGANIHNKTYQLLQDLEYYLGAAFWTGAYVFRPADPYPFPVGSLAENRVAADGPILFETQQSIGTWASQAIRSYAESKVLEFEWLVGPIPINDYHGKEVIAKYVTNINSSDAFFTDTNGRGVLKRRVNKRDDWKFTGREAVSSNYYPVTSHISVNDGFRRLTVLTDRAQGGTSLHDGEVELMVHRRLCYDDGKGVNEPLNETAYGSGLVVRGKHWVLLTDEPDPRYEETVEKLSLLLQQPPVLLLAPTDVDSYQWRISHLSKFSGLKSELNANLRILTLEPWMDDTLLLRVEHMFEKTSLPPLSDAVQIQLRGLFTAFEIVTVRETMLAADRWLEEDKGWLPGDHLFTIEPATIRTFLVQVSRRKSFM